VVTSAVNKAVRAVLRDEFKAGAGPNGPWQLTTRGKQPMQSKKLPGAFKGKVNASGILFTGRTKRDLLAALNAGHVFSARKVQANRQYLSFTKNGRLVAGRKLFNKKNQLRRGAYQRFAAAHTVGPRTLPARPMYPDGALPPTWDEPISAAVQTALDDWAKQVEVTNNAGA